MPRGGARQDRAEPRPDRPLWDSEPGEGPGRTERTPRGGRRGRGGGGTPQGGPGSDRKSKEWEEKRRQNIEKMNEEMEKIAEYERGQRGDGDKNPIRNFLDDPRRCGPIPDTDRKEGSRRHVRNWGGLDFDNVKTGAEVEKEWMQSRRPGSKGSVDMTLSMTGRERAEYLRWKKEREQIDEERLARHRNATGQWRREWDAQKTDTMFREEAAVATESTPDLGIRRDDSKRPPKAPTLADFLGQGRAKEGGRGGRGGRGKGRSQNKSYSMHDNRWEAEKEDEGEMEPDQERVKEQEQEKEMERESEVKKSPPPADEEQRPSPAHTVEVAVETGGDGGAAEEDEDEWEDASDGEEAEEEEEELESEEEEAAEKVVLPEKTKVKTPPTSPPTSPSHPQGATDGAKDQRTPRPRVQIPSPQSAQDSPESTKPLSPFSPMEGYHPVSDWGEEMEMQSPRVTLGESPLKPDSTGAKGGPVAPKPESPVPVEPQCEKQAPSPPGEQETETSEQTVSLSQEEPGLSESQSHDAPAETEPTEPTCHSPVVEEEPVPTSQVTLTESEEAETPVPPPESDENRTAVDAVTEVEVPDQPASG